MGNEESYELSTGLIDDFDCEVLDAWFATDAKVNNGQTFMLFWKMSTDDEESPEEEARWSCGGDWESLDGGKTIEHPKGKGKFNNQSAIGYLLKSALDAGAGPTLMERGKAQTAEVWIGLKFHMKREEFEWSSRDKPDVVNKSNRLLITEFYGEGDGSGPDKTATPSQASAPAEESILGTLDSDTVEALKKAKADTDNHAAFIDAAMELTSVTGNNNLIMAIATPDGLYSEL